MGSSDVFAGLNDAQRAAVEAARGPVAILAGAGTGKTTTITRRIAWQVTRGEFEASQVLALAFSVKAAREMGARLARLGVEGVRINTFHAEALAQFRRFAEDKPEIVSHKGQILHAIVSRLPAPHRFVPLRDYAGEIEWAKNRRIPARDYLQKVGSHEPPCPPDLMARVYVEYEKRKRRAGLIDFEDLLEMTVATLQSQPRALGVVRGRYRAFTVDEYQDVNLLQQSLLDEWVGAREDVCVVGDDYQSIYGFTGATPKYLLGFEGRYPQATVVTLTDNYRSTPEILDVANRLVPRMGGSRKTLRPVTGPGARPDLRGFDTARAETDWIVARCKELHAQGTALEDMAVLFRINGRSEDFEEAFARAGLAYQVRDGSFLSRAAARAFVARARRVEGAADEWGARIVADLGHVPDFEGDGGEEATRQADLSRLLAMSREFGARPVAEFLVDLRARFAPDEEGRGVQLMTYHRAKGLEFAAVFLPRLEDKEMPFALSRSAEEIAEERRLFYVGITRAKRFLAITYARAREGERRSRPKASPFLDEIRPAETKVRASETSRRAARVAEATPEEGLIGALAASPLFQRLKDWRKRVATEAGLPAYVVFHDATLAQIAKAKPSNRADLRAIPGVGPLKMQRYGEDLLEMITQAS